MKPIQIRIKRDYAVLTVFAQLIKAIDKIFELYKECLSIIVTIRGEFSGLSENQRNYYFGVPVKIIQDYTGYTKDETHRMLKAMFLTDCEGLLQNMIQPTGNDEKMFQLARFISLCDDITITTSEKGEFEEFLRKIRHYYSHLNIPLPNESQKWEGWERILN